MSSATQRQPQNQPQNRKAQAQGQRPGIDETAAAEKRQDGAERSGPVGTGSAERGGGETAKAAGETVMKSYESAVAMTKEQVETLLPRAVKGIDELASFSRGNLDAVADAGTIAASGWQKIGDEFVALNKEAFDASVDNARRLFEVKTMQDAVELQIGFAQTALDRWLAHSSEISELSVKVASESAEPINRRFSEALGTFFKPAA